MMQFTIRRIDGRQPGSDEFWLDRENCKMYVFDGHKDNGLKDVYKVYYAWYIIRYYELSDSYRDELFRMPMDDGSVLLTLPDTIVDVIQSKQGTQVFSFGKPGSVWELEYIEYPCEIGASVVEDVVRFSVWNNETWLGYRFELRVEEAAKFAECLREANLEMLEEAESI